jgi:hypothetical protein
MCFSAQADAVVGLALLPVGIAALREVRHVRELPFAVLPLLFGLHQLVEAVAWAGTDGDVSPGTAHAAVVAYLVIALVVLPTWFPLSVLLLEPRGARARVLAFVVLGAAVSAYFAVVLLRSPVSVVAHDHALQYRTDLDHGDLWTVLYVVAVIGPSLLSGYPTIVAFGVLNLVGLSIVAVVYQEAFTSVWCVWAGVTSLLVLLHMVRRRRLPNEHRLRGEPLVPQPL